MADEDIRKGKGYGFRVGSGKIYMVRCFACGKENYAAAVATGKCAWCGHDANSDIIGEISVIIHDDAVHLEVGIDIPPGEHPLKETIKGKYDQTLVLSELNNMLMTEGYNPTIHRIDPDRKNRTGWTNTIRLKEGK